jgi:SprT protein
METHAGDEWVARLREAARRHPASRLEQSCREWLTGLDMEGAARLVRVLWNPRMRTTAGYASYPSWRIELNPRLLAFEEQVERTLKHELAHLIAYHNAGGRRIEPHGAEWRHACALLGIPGEKACHNLPFPRARRQRKHTYQCPSCRILVHRVRRFSRGTACLRCCKAHNGGQYSKRFQFVEVQHPLPEE